MRAKLAEVLALAEIYSVTFFDWSPQPVSIGVDGDVPTWFDEVAEVIDPRRLFTASGRLSDGSSDGPLHARRPHVAFL